MDFSIERSNIGDCIVDGDDVAEFIDPPIFQNCPIRDLHRWGPRLHSKIADWAIEVAIGV